MQNRKLSKIGSLTKKRSLIKKRKLIEKRNLIEKGSVRKVMQDDEKFATYHEMAQMASMENPNLKIHTIKRTAYEEFLKMIKELQEKQVAPSSTSSTEIDKLLRHVYLGADLHYKVDVKND